MNNQQWARHYKRCIANKQFLIGHYERKGMDGAVVILEKEIANMQNKLNNLK